MTDIEKRPKDMTQDELDDLPEYGSFKHPRDANGKMMMVKGRAIAMHLDDIMGFTDSAGVEWRILFDSNLGWSKNPWTERMAVGDRVIGY